MSGSIAHAISSHSMMTTMSSGYSSFNEKDDNNNDQTSLNARNAKASSDFIITLSEQGQALSQDANKAHLEPEYVSNNAFQNPTDQESQNKVNNNQQNDTQQLTDEEKKQLDELKRRDQEVRIHELAHSSVGGAQTSAPSYSYTIGPDGKRYITEGEVSITVHSSSDDPETTIMNMEQVYRAALAPAEPSAADRKAAAEAQAFIREAREELAKQQRNDSTEEIRPLANTNNPYREPSPRGDFLNQIV